jgi:hypothetical protein
MRSEILNIGQHELRCEVFESELKIGSGDSKPVLILSLLLGRFGSQFLLGLGESFWMSVARRYLKLKSQVAAKTPNEIIGRISFECDDTRVEVEFTRFSEKVLRTLHLIVSFVNHYPRIAEIRSVREGPILVRFRGQEKKLASDEPVKSETGIKAWLAAACRSAGIIHLKSGN